jgi:hypothetical protein
MSSAYGHIAKPETDSQLESVLPIHETLRDGSAVAIEAVDRNNEALIEHMRTVFNLEIEDGFVKRELASKNYHL